MACRINKIPKAEYDYCNKGNFSLPKEPKDAKDTMKPIAALSK
jgi:hypothetical protein